MNQRRSRRRLPVTLLLAIAPAALFVGCSKKVDPAAFDAGSAAASPAAAPVLAPSAAASAPVEEAPAALASLAPAGKAPPVAADKAAPKKPNKALPECETARKFCNHPAAATDKAIQNLCTTNKQSCFAKGGTL
ncbi:MAG: hypothetical protein IPG50_08490 [Myxococcales bacterium]|nr:hypothetical protein [Myxococcales bacterium]